MAHLLHLKGVISGILVMWVGAKKLNSALKDIRISGEEGFKGTWQGGIVGFCPKNFASFGFMKTAVGTGEAQGLWLFLPFFRWFPVTSLLCTS